MPRNPHSAPVASQTPTQSHPLIQATSKRAKNAKRRPWRRRRRRQRAVAVAATAVATAATVCRHTRRIKVSICRARECSDMRDVWAGAREYRVQSLTAHLVKRQRSSRPCPAHQGVEPCRLRYDRRRDTDRGPQKSAASCTPWEARHTHVGWLERSAGTLQP